MPVLFDPGYGQEPFRTLVQDVPGVDAVARYSSSAFSFSPSLRINCSDGTRSPASSREMYAAEHPGKESWRCEKPAARRASLSRRPTAAGSST